MVFSCVFVQISEDEITFLTGGDDPYDDNVVLKKLFHPNLKLLIVTEGSKGCRYYTKVCLPNPFHYNVSFEAHNFSFYLCFVFYKQISYVPLY